MRNKNLLKVISIACIVIVLDQLSKYLVLDFFTHNQQHAINIALFLNIVLVWNYGISFGMFNQASQSQIALILLSMAIIVGLIVWVMRSKDSRNLLPVALIIGGAVGNIIDRVIYGAVIDFIDFYLVNYHYPSFNLADSAIVVGAILLMIQTFQDKEYRA